MTNLEQLAAVVADSEPSAAALERLPIHLLDAVGAWVAGRATTDAEAFGRLWAAGATLPAFGAGPLDRLARRVVETRLTEVDDIHMMSCTTPGSVVVPAALTLAGSLGRVPSARDVAAATIAGYEAMTRLGTAIAGPEILWRGVWPTFFVAPVGAAAVAARLLRLDAAQTADALATALSLCSGAPGGAAKNPPRFLLLGLAARDGVTAALAAAAGFDGDRTLLDGDWLQKTHGIALDPAPLVSSVGGGGAMDQLSVKPYCAAKQVTAAMDGFCTLVERGLALDEVVHVRVTVPPVYAAMIGHKNAHAGRMPRITGAAYQLALAAYRPDALLDVVRADYAADERIAAFMGKVEVLPDPDLAKYFPAQWPARIEATLAGGGTESVLVTDSRGDPARAFDREAAREKFAALARPQLGERAADALADLCLDAASSDAAMADLVARVDAIDAVPAADRGGASA